MLVVNVMVSLVAKSDIALTVVICWCDRLVFNFELWRYGYLHTILERKAMTPLEVRSSRPWTIVIPYRWNVFDQPPTQFCEATHVNMSQLVATVLSNPPGRNM